VAPAHCTGEPAFEILKEVFGDHYIYAGLGTTIGLGANPAAGTDKYMPHELDDAADMQAYRAFSVAEPVRHDHGSMVRHDYQPSRGTYRALKPL
jgi:7,8-dihydropterin-6-yl-methyl-4-(beta-D-ribofuranosyl)aminobenzene 5'-phosphate synthase